MVFFSRAAHPTVRRAEIPLNDWLQRHVQNVVKVPLRYAVNSALGREKLN